MPPKPRHLKLVGNSINTYLSSLESWRVGGTFQFVELHLYVSSMTSDEWNSTNLIRLRSAFQAVAKPTQFHLTLNGLSAKTHSALIEQVLMKEVPRLVSGLSLDLCEMDSDLFRGLVDSCACRLDTFVVSSNGSFASDGTRAAFSQALARSLARMLPKLEDLVLRVDMDTDVAFSAEHRVGVFQSLTRAKIDFDLVSQNAPISIVNVCRKLSQEGKLISFKILGIRERSADSAEAMIGSISSLISSNLNLRHVTVANCIRSNNSYDKLKKNPWKYFGSDVENHPSLEILNLEGNHFLDDGFGIAMQGIVRNKQKLESLFLDRCLVSEMVFKTVTNHIKESASLGSSLRAVDLNSTINDGTSFNDLAIDCIKVCPRIKFSHFEPANQNLVRISRIYCAAYVNAITWTLIAWENGREHRGYGFLHLLHSDIIRYLFDFLRES